MRKKELIEKIQELREEVFSGEVYYENYSKEDLIEMYFEFGRQEGINEALDEVEKLLKKDN